MRTTLFALFAVLPLVNLPLAAQTFDGFGYSVSGTNIVITNYTGPGGVITVPSSIPGVNGTVTAIGDRAFAGRSGLSSVTIPGSVTSIGDSAFYQCYGLTNVTLPGGVTSIGDSAFSYCWGLTNVALPGSVTSIGDEAFAGCSGLTAFTVDAQNPFYSSLGGVLFNKDQTTLVLWPPGRTGAYTIPGGVTAVGDYAFCDCGYLTEVTVPRSVTSIGDEAFAGDPSLKSVLFLGNAPSLGVGPFFSLIPWEADAYDPTTAYYLPGTAGWGAFAANAGIAIALWQARILLGDPSFGVRTNQFGFTVNGTSGTAAVVEATTNLASAAWTPLATNTLATGAFYLSDPEWTNYPSRFYRVRPQ